MDLVNLRLTDEGEAPAAPLAEQLGALEDLRQQGKLDLIGSQAPSQRTVRL